MVRSTSLLPKSVSLISSSLFPAPRFPTTRYLIFNAPLDLDLANMLRPEQIYIASHYVTMRGTINFERLTCSNKKYVRITLNDAVYRKLIEPEPSRYMS